MGFADDIQKWNKRTLNLMDRTAQQFGRIAYTGVVKRSPIKTGRYRASHRIGIGTKDTSFEPVRTGLSELTIGVAPTSTELAYMDTQLKRVRFGTTIIISNSLPYAGKLEDGSSAQNGHAPDGIYGATRAELTARRSEVIQAVRSGKTELGISRS